MPSDMRIGGYAVRFDEPATIYTRSGTFTEIVRKGAFARTLRERPDVFLLDQHDFARPIARTRNGTLTLVEDARGLRFEATLPDTTVARDVYEMIRTGVLGEMSFSFNAVEDRWSDMPTGPQRELFDADLLEISVVTRPAYKTTSVATRRKVTPAVQRRLGQLRARRLEVARV
ncbi:MAG: HK97 family phage prohead protease [Planctomycetaceae bacterium]|nr:HK97 family phage prohead protease [Planctomycetaceae bacterium]